MWIIHDCQAVLCVFRSDVCLLQYTSITVFEEGRGHKPHRCIANLRTFVFYVFITAQLVSGFNDSSSVQDLKGLCITRVKECSRSPSTDTEFCVQKKNVCDKIKDGGAT